MIRFAYNIISWDEETNRPVLGGMADRMVSPIFPHLPEYEVDRWPAEGRLNAYLSMPGIYGDRFVKGGVLVSHGIADKGIRLAQNLKDSFSYVTVPGPLHAKRLAGSGYPAGKIVEVGYPKLDPIFQGKVEPPPRDDRIRVVYAPTHGGGGEHKHLRDTRPPRINAAKRTSYWTKDEVLRRLDPDEFDVVVALHPRHRPDRQATLQEYVGADVVIADGGSTIFEAWALGIPVVFPSWITAAGHRGSGTIEAAIYAKKIGSHCWRAYDLPRLVKIAARDGMRDEEVWVIEKILPTEYRGVSGRLHAEFLLSLDH